MELIDSPDTKYCPTCERDRDRSEFHRNKSNSDSLDTYCKNCKRIKGKAYRNSHKKEIKAYLQSHKKEIKAKMAIYRETHKEEIAASSKVYRSANKKTISAQRKVYYRINSKKLKARAKAYREANSEERKIYNKAYYDSHKEQIKTYYEANKESIKVRHKAYRKANKEKIEAQKKAYHDANPRKRQEYWRKAKRKRRALKYETQSESINEKIVYTRDGWKCQICHKKVNKKLKHPNPMCASLDHIIPLSEGGNHAYANVQLAHLGCNISKHNNVLPQGEQLRIF